MPFGRVHDRDPINKNINCYFHTQELSSIVKIKQQLSYSPDEDNTFLSNWLQLHVYTFLLLISRLCHIQ